MTVLLHILAVPVGLIALIAISMLAAIIVHYFMETVGIILLGMACYWLGYNLFQVLGWL